MIATDEDLILTISTNNMAADIAILNQKKVGVVVVKEVEL